MFRMQSHSDRPIKMFSNPKHVFWQAFLAAAIIFAFGIWMGFLLESYRTTSSQVAVAKAELDLTDIRLQSELYKNGVDINCDSAVKENILFADKIYEEAKELDKSKKANQFTEDIVYQHKRFDILRVIFWLNSIHIKEKCNSGYHNIVYFYQYAKPDIGKKAEQGVVSDVLTDVKEKYGDKVMLIPIAADNNITSITLLAEYYNITYLPTVLIDEKIKLEGLKSIEEVEAALEKLD
jgi:hypothetical protein